MPAMPSLAPATTRRDTAIRRAGVALLAAAGVSFVALAWTSQRGTGMLWDEKVDLDIAAALLDHPLYGSGVDGSQTRLPMAVNAAVLAVLGPSLATSRAISVAVGLLAVLTTFGLARRLFDGTTALLAAAMVAFSPHFLGFARIAMTEGDVFPALFVTLACWAYVCYADRRDGPRLAIAAAALGLAIAAKLYALFLVPVFGLCEFAAARARTGDEPESPATPSVSAGRWVLAALGCLVLVAGTSLSAQIGPVALPIVGWVLTLALTVVVWVGLVRAAALGISRAAGWVVLSVMGVVVACVTVPQHLVHPDIARTIARRTVHWDHMLPGSLWLDHLRLYSGVVLIAGTIPVGLASAAAVVWAWIREAEVPSLRLPVFAITFYVLALSMLPLRQTFYLMSVYPLLAMLTAAMLTALWRWLAGRSRAAGRIGAILILLVVGQQIATALRAWPDYNLYPRRWVGQRWLGAEARGYRNLIQTPCDGYAELVAWCLEHVRPDEQVVSYLWADHVLDELLPAELPFKLVRRGVFEAANRGLPRPDPPPVDRADYVLLHVNNLVEYHDAPPRHPRFTDGPVLVVYRDGDFPIAMIYRARDRQ